MNIKLTREVYVDNRIKVTPDSLTTIYSDTETDFLCLDQVDSSECDERTYLVDITRPYDRGFFVRTCPGQDDDTSLDMKFISDFYYDDKAISSLRLFKQDVTDTDCRVLRMRGYKKLEVTSLNGKF
jgi:hypothetical protein